MHNRPKPKWMSYARAAELEILELLASALAAARKAYNVYRLKLKKRCESRMAEEKKREG